MADVLDLDALRLRLRIADLGGDLDEFHRLQGTIAAAEAAIAASEG